jgi:hypothetical protein
MNRNLVGSIYGRSSIKIAHFVPIHWQTWPPQAILVSDWPISKKSPLKPLCQIIRNLVGRIYGRSSVKLLISSQSVNKHGHHRLLLFLIGWFLKNSSPLKPFSQMKRNLVGSIYGRSSIKIAHVFPIHLQTWPPQAILVSDWYISKNLLLWNRLAKWTETW